MYPHGEGECLKFYHGNMSPGFHRDLGFRIVSTFKTDSQLGPEEKCNCTYANMEYIIYIQHEILLYIGKYQYLRYCETYNAHP